MEPGPEGQLRPSPPEAESTPCPTTQQVPEARGSLFWGLRGLLPSPLLTPALSKGKLRHVKHSKSVFGQKISLNQAASGLTGGRRGRKVVVVKSRLAFAKLLSFGCGGGGGAVSILQMI